MKRYFIFGDSHILPFENFKDFEVEKYDACTAQGLINDKSVSQAGNKIKEYLKKYRNKDIYLQFGKVDLDFVVPYKQSVGQKITYKEQIEKSTEALIDFARSLVLNTKSITFLGLHLPTLPSKQMKVALKAEWTLKNAAEVHEIEGLTEDNIEISSLELRSLYVIMFNKILQQKAMASGYAYVDVIEETLNFDTGIIDEHFISHPSDFHCHRKRMSEIYEVRLFEK